MEATYPSKATNLAVFRFVHQTAVCVTNRVRLAHTRYMRTRPFQRPLTTNVTEMAISVILVA